MLTQAELKARLNYDPETGIFTWIKRIRRKGSHPNSIAGNLCDGYIRIKVNGKLYRAHRLAFLYMTGSTPLDCTDPVSYTHLDVYKRQKCNIIMLSGQGLQPF